MFSYVLNTLLRHGTSRLVSVQAESSLMSLTLHWDLVLSQPVSVQRECFLMSFTLKHGTSQLVSVPVFNTKILSSRPIGCKYCFQNFHCILPHSCQLEICVRCITIQKKFCQNAKAYNCQCNFQQTI